MSVPAALRGLFAAAAAALLGATPLLGVEPGTVPAPAQGIEGTLLTPEAVEGAAESTLTPAQAAAAVEEGLGADHPGTAHVSVRDAATGRELVAERADEPVTPASSLKILTAATALRALGPEATLRTRTVLVDPARLSTAVTTPSPASTWAPAPSSSWTPSSTWTPAPSSTWTPAPSSSWTPPPSWTPAPSTLPSAAPTPTATPGPSSSPEASAPTAVPTPTSEPSGTPSPSDAPPQEDAPAQVVLVGGGDVLLGTQDSDPDAVSGRAGLRTLAEETAAALVAEGVTGEVVLSVDLRLFEGSGRNPAWAEDLYEEGYISPVQPLATFGGRPAYGTGQERIEDPAAYAAERFQAELVDAVAALDADLTVTVADTVPQTTAPRRAVVEAEPLAQVESAPLAEQVGFLLAHSDNQLAEALSLTSAYALGREPTSAGAAELLADVAADLGAPPGGLAAEDASGLAGGNRITAAQLTAVLAAAARTPSLDAVIEALPEPGTDSTMDERLLGTVAEDRVSAKTGTLLAAVSLTGTVTTADGQVLLFSIVLDGIDSDVTGAREAIDGAVVALAGL